MNEKYRPQTDSDDQPSFSSVEKRADSRERMLKSMLIVNAYSPSVCLQESDFYDTYKEGHIHHDLELVEKLKARFVEEAAKNNRTETDKENKIRSEAMERIIAEHGDMSEWFGPEAHIIKTTEYDDIVNGVDFVLEFNLEDPDAVGLEGEVPRIALAIDATSAQNVDTVSDKINNCIKKMRGGKFEVKYFASQVDPDEKGPIRNIVPVVIGIECGNVNQLIDDVYQLIRMGQTVDKTPAQKELYREVKDKVVNNPAQMVFLQEIILQLELYSRVMEGTQDAGLLRQITSLKQIIENVYDAKKEDGLSEGPLADDHTLKVIRSLTVQ